MKFLLDTCALSELVKPAPNPGVVQWFSQQDELTLYLAAVSVGELNRGITRLDAGKRKSFLQKWLNENVIKRFADRILPLDTEVFVRWGELQARLDAQGAPMPAFDSLIAALALQHRLTIVTRDTKGMQGSGVDVVNPWR
ncbi:MAG: type II toxin-antitoxin system VapC family toxin [Burkholderiales bacterium]|nr:type II toxin-antitoxin system VapC family toxin [Burkholderiales bacterium]